MTPNTERGANVVIPIKGLAAGKTRLASVLSPAEREALNRRLTEHVLHTALKTRMACETYIDIYLVSPDEAIADIAASCAVHFLRQTTQGLNAGLSEAASHLPDRRTVFLASDLPKLISGDIEALLRTDSIGIAPDHLQTGTNALSVPAPEALPFHFGSDSMKRHLDSAQKLGIPVQVIQRPGLAADLDTKEDLERIKGWK